MKLEFQQRLSLQNLVQVDVCTQIARQKTSKFNSKIIAVSITSKHTNPNSKSIQ